MKNGRWKVWNKKLIIIGNQNRKITILLTCPPTPNPALPAREQQTGQKNEASLVQPG